jgi:6-phosphogluconolactonase
LLDERVVSVDHVDSNEGQLRAKFLDKLIEEGNIRESQFISIDMSRTNISESYSQIVPRIDIALFGVGPDGHIASLFPHHPLLDSLETGYLEIIDAPKPPAHRITVSPDMIRGISHVFVVFMRGKEEVYARFFDESISIRDCPVRLLYQSMSLVVMSDIVRAKMISPITSIL